MFSRTLKTADWANTTIAAGDTAEEIDKLRRGGDGHIVVWGGVSFWRSLMWLDLIDEFYLSLYPYVSDEGTRLFDNVPSPTGSTWSPAPPKATGSSSCSTVGTADPPAGRRTDPMTTGVICHDAVPTHGPSRRRGAFPEEFQQFCINMPALNAKMQDAGVFVSTPACAVAQHRRPWYGSPEMTS